MAKKKNKGGAVLQGGDGVPVVITSKRGVTALEVATEKLPAVVRRSRRPVAI